MSVSTDRGIGIEGIFAAFFAALMSLKAGVASKVESIKQAYFQELAECMDVYTDVQRKGIKETAACRAGQDRDVVGVMLLVVIAAVIGFVGLTVMARTEDTTSFSTGSAFSNGSDNLQQAVETVFSLIEVVFIAIMLALIIGALLFLRRRQGG